MISRRAAETLMIFVLVLSLSLKIVGDTSAQTTEVNDVQSSVADLLEHQGFEVTHDTPDVDLFPLAGVRGQCSLLVAVISPLGWHRDVIRKSAPPGSTTIFVFDGTSYRDQPVLRTRVDYYWTRFLRYAGFNHPVRPVLGIVGSPECELDKMASWGTFAVMPGT
jgi:hypothetical protein